MKNCKICFAKIPHWHVGAETCGTICSEAKRMGRTYAEQMKIEANKKSEYHTYDPNLEIDHIAETEFKRRKNENI